MTEADWLTSGVNPARLVRVARAKAARPLARKLRLLAAACCRLGWDHLLDPRGRAAVDLLERYADGLVGEAEFAAARAAAVRASVEADFDGWEADPAAALLFAVAAAVHPDVAAGADRCADWVVQAAINAAPDGRSAARARRQRQVCGLIREVFGNPFRPWAAAPDWLGGGLVQPDGRTVHLSAAARGLADGVWADQAWDRLPVLADALEEAGVTDPGLLSHCRGPGPHVRGCWALDAVLGRP